MASLRDDERLRRHHRLRLIPPPGRPIRSFSDRPEHDVRNGLLLRSDVHRLFDAGYVTVTPQYVVEVSHRVRDDFNDGENYLRMHGEGIVVPEREGWQPDREALTWHNDNKFRA